MGIIDTLLGRNRAVNSVTYGIASPWAETSLAPVVISDVFGFDIAKLPMTRELALTVPAVAKARNLIVSNIAGLPLEALHGEGPLSPATQPAFLYRSNTPVTPYDRMASTVDDLIFYGKSLWLVERGTLQEGSAHAPILSAEWCPPEMWKIENGAVVVNDVPQGEEAYILFNVPRFPGLLKWGVTTLNGARDTEQAWTDRMKSPMFMVELHRIEDGNLSQEEADAYVAAWRAKYVAGGNSAVGYTPPEIEIKTHQGSMGAADLFLESRNAIRIDVASFLNIPAVAMDASLAEASLTYSTTEGNRNVFFDELKFWTQPIEAQLSADAVVPRGQRVRFDKGEQTAAVASPTDAPEQD
jgi:hypothetical protein